MWRRSFKALIIFSTLQYFCEGGRELSTCIWCTTCSRYVLLNPSTYYRMFLLFLWLQEPCYSWFSWGTGQFFHQDSSFSQGICLDRKLLLRPLYLLDYRRLHRNIHPAIQLCQLLFSLISFLNEHVLFFSFNIGDWTENLCWSFGFKVHFCKFILGSDFILHFVEYIQLIVNFSNPF